MRVLKIFEGTSVDGPGLRTAIYFAGCSHHCPGCHNPQSWDPAAGTDMSVDDIMEVVADAGWNVTFSGGDPLMQDIDALCQLADRIHGLGLTVWCYTGYTIEQIRSSADLSPILDHVDALVDGPFEQSLRDTTLRFRGSSNQRIIYLR